MVPGSDALGDYIDCRLLRRRVADRSDSVIVGSVHVAGPVACPPEFLEGVFYEVRNIKGIRERAYSTAKAYIVCGPCRLPARQLPC